MTISDERRSTIKKGRESNKRRNIIKKRRESNKRRNIIKKRRESKEYDVTFKIVILGVNSAPKTSVILRYLSGYFMQDVKLTLGVDFYSKTTLFNGKKVKLQFWNFGGEERFRFLLSQYSKGADGAIFLYDISNRATFIHLHDWTQIFREHTENVPIILAGASLGLEEDRIITSDEGFEAAKKYNLDGFIEVSPKTGENIEELFNAIIRLALQTYSVKKKVEPKEISPLHEQKQQNIEKEDDKRLSLEKKGENKRIVLKEGDVKKRLRDLVVKLKDLDIDLEKLEITWNSFLGSIDEYNKAKFKDNYLIPYARYLESKLRRLQPRVYERIDDKVDKKYIHNLERRFFPRKIFKVNDFLTLKLVHDRTFIYIKGKKFIQCIRLSLQIPPQARHLYEEIESIDEAAEVYKQTLFENRIVEGPAARSSRIQNRSITPKEEFWGHCSNIQAWVGHEYDTRLLHSNLSFPLLKALSDAGDPKAKAIFEEEIAIRLESGYPSVVNYLLEQGYLRYLDTDQLKTLLENYADVDLNEQFIDYLSIKDTKKSIRHQIKRSLEKALDIDSKFTRLANTKNTILIVGKEPNLDLTVKFLKLGDHDTITCSNAKEALKVLEERYFDIAMILLDPMMPELNTEKFVQSVKSDERYKHIKIALLPKKDT